MEFKDQEKYMELGKLGLFGVVLGFLGYSFFGILYIFFPMLFMESSVKNGILSTMGVMLGVSLVIGLVFNMLAGLSLFFVFAPMVLAFHYMVTSKRGYVATLILMAVVLILSSVSLQMGLTPLGTVNLEEISEELIQSQIDGVGENLTGLEASRLEENLRLINEMSIKLIPGMFFIFILFTVYLNYVMAGRRLLRHGILINQPPIFSNLQLPRISIIVFGIIIGVILLLQNSGMEIYEVIYLNSLLVFGLLFFVNGLALVSNLLGRLKMPNFVKTFILLGLVFFIPAGAVVVILGLLDALVVFRKIRIKRE